MSILDPTSAGDQVSESFLALTAEMHCIVTQDGRFHEVRGAWHRILGWRTDELLGTRYADLVHPEDLHKTANEHAQNEAGQGTRGFRNRYRCKDGSYRWVEWRSTPLGNDGFIYAVASDRGDTSEVLTSSLLFEELIQNVHDPVYVLSADEGAFRMVYANDAAVRHFRYPKDVLLTLAVPDFDKLHPAAKCREFLAVLRKERRLVFETVHTLGDGTNLPVEVSASHLKLGDEELIAGSIRDITERRKVFESIEKHAGALEAVNRELEELAYIASHDLREPLRTIFSHLEMVKRGSANKLDRHTLDNVDFSIDAAQRLNRLIRDLLSYGSLKKHTLRVAEVNLGTVINEVISDLRARIEETRARVDIISTGTLKADHSLLRSLMQNLLTNALKFTDPGRRPQVTIKTYDDAENWYVQVADNGIGIPREDLERIFRMFQRLHAPNEYPGSGLGLAICERIAKAHQGRIWATSILSQGSEFTVQLPKDSPRLSQ